MPLFNVTVALEEDLLVEASNETEAREVVEEQRADELFECSTMAVFTYPNRANPLDYGSFASVLVAERGWLDGREYVDFLAERDGLPPEGPLQKEQLPGLDV